MIWEIVFLLIVLKIPIVYVCAVVWWAIKAEPEPSEPASLIPVTDTPSPAPWKPRARPGSRRDSGRRGRPGGRSTATRPVVAAGRERR